VLTEENFENQKKINSSYNQKLKASNPTPNLLENENSKQAKKWQQTSSSFFSSLSA